MPQRSPGCCPSTPGPVSAVQQGLIHPGMDVDAVAGSHIDEILQACAVPRYLVQVACIDSGGQALLGRRDLCVQLLNHERHLLPCAGIAGWRAGVLDRRAGKRCPEGDGTGARVRNPSSNSDDKHRSVPDRGCGRLYFLRSARFCDRRTTTTIRTLRADGRDGTARRPRRPPRRKPGRTAGGSPHRSVGERGSACPRSGCPTRAPPPRSVTFNYELAWLSPVLDGRLVACHALEIPFVFDTLDLGHRQMPGGALGEHPPQERGPRRHERRYTR